MVSGYCMYIGLLSNDYGTSYTGHSIVYTWWTMYGEVLPVHTTMKPVLGWWSRWGILALIKLNDTHIQSRFKSILIQHLESSSRPRMKTDEQWMHDLLLPPIWRPWSTFGVMIVISRIPCETYLVIATLFRKGSSQKEEVVDQEWSLQQLRSWPTTFLFWVTYVNASRTTEFLTLSNTELEYCDKTRQWLRI